MIHNTIIPGYKLLYSNIIIIVTEMHKQNTVNYLLLIINRNTITYSQSK